MSKPVLYGLIIIGLLLILFVPFFTNIVHLLLRILAPFLIAALISYLLYPFYRKLTNHGWPELLTILFLLSVSFLLVGLLIYKLYLLLVPQINEWKIYMMQSMKLSELWMDDMTRILASYPTFMQELADQTIQFIQVETEKRTVHLLGQVQDIIQFIVFLTIVPLLVFFMIKDFATWKENIRAKYDLHIVLQIDIFLQTLDERLGSYVKGQIILSIFITVISFFLYSILQIDYALFFAILIGILNVIPFFGPILGAIPVIFISLQTSWQLAFMVIFFMIIIQILENSLLSPYIFGKTMNIHPMLVFFLLIIGAEIAGIVGMIFIIPLYLIMQSFRSISF